jgi:hypothetical protein
VTKKIIGKRVDELQAGDVVFLVDKGRRRVTEDAVESRLMPGLWLVWFKDGFARWAGDDLVEVEVREVQP